MPQHAKYRFTEALAGAQICEVLQEHILTALTIYIMLKHQAEAERSMSCTDM